MKYGRENRGVNKDDTAEEKEVKDWSFWSF
jgi:hypothetical protein